MREARKFAAYSLVGPGGWNLTQITGDCVGTPLYLGGVLSVKEQEEESFDD